MQVIPREQQSGREREGKCVWNGGCEKHGKSLHNHFEFHNKQQKSNLRTCKKYRTHAMQHATNSGNPLPLSTPLAYPVKSIEKFAAALANRQNGIRISGRTHKKAMWQARRWRRSRVRDMEKLLWFYWNQSMGVAYSPSLCLDRPPLPANNMK